MLGTARFDYAQETVFLVSLTVILYLISQLVKELDGAHEVSIRRDWSRVFREGVER